MKFLLAITLEGLLSQRREKIPKTNLLNDYRSVYRGMREGL